MRPIGGRWGEMAFTDISTNPGLWRDPRGTRSAPKAHLSPAGPYPEKPCGSMGPMRPRKPFGHRKRTSLSQKKKKKRAKTLCPTSCQLCVSTLHAPKRPGTLTLYPRGRPDSSEGPLPQEGPPTDTPNQSWQEGHSMHQEQGKKKEEEEEECNASRRKKKAQGNCRNPTTQSSRVEAPKRNQTPPQGLHNIGSN